MNPTRMLFSLAILLPGAAAPASAQQPATQSREHLVRRGDTLWGLAQFYFTNPFLWPTIYEANRDVVEDPHWIYPGERLMIPGVESGLPIAVQQEAAEVSGVFVATDRPADGRTRFYTPPAPPNEERAFALINRSEPLYAVSPGEYNSAAWLADSASAGIRGRLIGLADPASQGDKLPSLLHPYDAILVGAMRGDGANAGDSMLVVRFDAPVGTLGNVVVPVALVRIDSVGENVLAAHVIRQYGPARVGDHMIPFEPATGLRRGEPTAISGGAEGTLVAFLEGDPLFGTYDNGFVDIGQADGLTVGDELIAFIAARPGGLRGAELPQEVVATLRVIKVRDNSATVRVTATSSTALREGLPVRVVRRMQ